MKKRLTFLFAAILALPCLCVAGESVKDDSVKVIKSPNQVVITKKDGMFRLNVDGNETDKDYRYEYLVKAHDDGTLFAQESEGGRVKFRHPFAKCDSSYKNTHWEVFLSDLYFGWGGIVSPVLTTIL